MLSVALTGNVASGKSTVAELWARAGVPVVSADELARRAVQPGTEALEAIRRAFGGEMLAADGTLDRERMRALVFSDGSARERLEANVHPVVRTLGAEWIRERRAEGEPLAVTEIPLLYETGREGDFDLAVLVDASPEARLERLVRIRGLDEREARAMMDAQMDPERKRAAADVVIDNAGSLEELGASAARVLAELRARAGAEPPAPAGAGPLRMDLHLHTSASYDCLSDPEAVLARAIALGYGRIAITDHNTLEAALVMAAAHPEHVIVGEEVRTAEGVDVIGLYLSEEIPKGTPALETIRRIRDQGGIVYLPHPYAAGKGGGGRLAEELAPLCDVVEVFNARLHSDVLNERAAALATRHGTLRGAGSDAHTVAEVGNAFVEVAHHAHRPDALLAALATARTGGSTASRLVHLASTWAKVVGRR